MNRTFAAKFGLCCALTVIASTAQAASSTASGSGTLNTSVTLNFSVTIPRFVFLRVGAAGATVNTLAYAPTVAQITGSTPVLATGGDTGTGNSDVTIQVIGNAGNVTLTAVTSNPNLTSGSNNIPWTTLSVTSPTGSITAPPFNTGSTVLTATNSVVSQLGSWRYVWTAPANTTYPSGTYNGTATYTAATP